jgi:SAM-dependent methyltransferase
VNVTVSAVKMHTLLSVAWAWGAAVIVTVAGLGGAAQKRPERIVRLATLDIDSPNWPHGVYYEPINPATFRDMMAAARLDCARFTFIDFGAGKGRGLLLAAEFPFRKIIGVEFAPQLVEIAWQNLARCRVPRRQCRDVEVVLADAAQFPLPDGPLALLFNNPFEEPVMAAVIANLRRSLEVRPRAAVVLCTYPYLDRLWSRLAVLRRGTEGRNFVIYAMP